MSHTKEILISIGKIQFLTLDKYIKESIKGFGIHKHPVIFTHRGRRAAHYEINEGFQNKKNSISDREKSA